MVAHRAGEQADRCVDHGQRRRFAAREHEVAKRQFFGGEVIGDALIDVLVVATEDRQLCSGRESHSVGLLETAPARAHQHDGRHNAQRLDRLEERTGLHHHPRAATVWRVVHRAMPIMGEVAQVHDVIRHGTGSGSARGDAQPERRKKLGEDRDDVDLHSTRPSGGVTMMTRRSLSTEAMVWSSYSMMTVSASCGVARRTSIARPWGSS